MQQVLGQTAEIMSIYYAPIEYTHMYINVSVKMSTNYKNSNGLEKMSSRDRPKSNPSFLSEITPVALAKMNDDIASSIEYKSLSPNGVRYLFGYRCKTILPDIILSGQKWLKRCFGCRVFRGS